MIVSERIRENVRDIASSAALGYMLRELNEQGLDALGVDMLAANKRYRAVRDAMVKQFPTHTDVHARNVEPETIGAVRYALDFAQRRQRVADAHADLIKSDDGDAWVEYARAFEAVPLFADES